MLKSIALVLVAAVAFGTMPMWYKTLLPISHDLFAFFRSIATDKDTLRNGVILIVVGGTALSIALGKAGIVK